MRPRQPLVYQGADRIVGGVENLTPFGNGASAAALADAHHGLAGAIVAELPRRQADRYGVGLKSGELALQSPVRGLYLLDAAHKAIAVFSSLPVGDDATIPQNQSYRGSRRKPGDRTVE